MATRQEREELRAQIRSRFGRKDRSALLPALHYLEERFGYLPDWAMEVVGWVLAVPASEVYGAATSYTELRLRPPATRTLRVCTGPACRIAGAEALLQALKAGSHGDRDTTVEETPCAFLCAMAPAVAVNGRWRGRVAPEEAADLLAEEARP